VQATLRLREEERLKPRYKGIAVTRAWVLRSLSAEPEGAYPGGSEVPIAIDCYNSPEAVVEAQLAALRREDADAVFAFASPENKKHTGPSERFYQMLSSPIYSPLLGHVSYTTYARTQVSPYQCAQGTPQAASPKPQAPSPRP